ncbi:MAG: hypothetical protein WDO69_14640 [Pseudomonadota bacterium]
MNTRARSLLLIVPLLGLHSFACSSSALKERLVAEGNEFGTLGLALQLARQRLFGFRDPISKLRHRGQRSRKPHGSGWLSNSHVRRLGEVLDLLQR